MFKIKVKGLGQTAIMIIYRQEETIRRNTNQFSTNNESYGPENVKKKKKRQNSNSSESEKEKKHKKHKKSEKKHKKNKKRKHRQSTSEESEVKIVKPKKSKKKDNDNEEKYEWVELTKELREEEAQRHKEEEAQQIGPQIPEHLLQKSCVSFYDDDNIRSMYVLVT